MLEAIGFTFVGIVSGVVFTLFALRNHVYYEKHKQYSPLTPHVVEGDDCKSVYKIKFTPNRFYKLLGYKEKIILFKIVHDPYSNHKYHDQNGVLVNKDDRIAIAIDNFRRSF